MRLSELDDKTVRIITIDGKIFEGECTYDSAEYCEMEYGRDEEALRIDHYVFYAGDIADAKEIEEKEEYVWESKPMHLMHLDSYYYQMMEKGLKTIEMRLYDERRQRIQKGDFISFTDVNDEYEVMHVLVEDLFVFDNFRELYENVDLLQCGYTPENVKDADPADMNRFYPPEEQAKYKAVGIKVKTDWEDI